MGRHKLMEDDELLRKVREIVIRDGINVSSHKIAKEIGISNSVLFQRFSSKENLMFAAMTPPAPEMATLLDKDIPQGNALAHLEQSLQRLIEYFRKLVPVLLPLATHPSFHFDTFIKKHPNSPLEKLTVELMATLEEKKQKGEIDCQDVGTVVLAMEAIASGLAVFEKIGVHEIGYNEAAIRGIARLIWHGIKG